MRKLPPLNAVRAFEAAARHESLTLAAQELHVTHGAVSRQVALLEAWLGRTLFARGRAQVALNEAGRTYLSEITAVLDRLAVASHQAQERSAAPAAARHTLRVSAPPTFTMRWLIPRLSTFQRQQPLLEVQLTTSLEAVDFAHGYDLAIRGAQSPLRGARSRAFMTETIVPVCLAAVRDKGLVQPKSLVQHTLISYDTEPYAWAAWLKAAGVAGLQPAKTLNFEQMYFALQAANAGLGVVLVPLFLVAEDMAAGRLCAPFGTLGAKRRRYYANQPLQGPRSPAVDAFLNWLLEEGQATEMAIKDGWTQKDGWTPP